MELAPVAEAFTAMAVEFVPMDLALVPSARELFSLAKD